MNDFAVLASSSETVGSSDLTVSGALDFLLANMRMEDLPLETKISKCIIPPSTLGLFIHVPVWIEISVSSDWVTIDSDMYDIHVGDESLSGAEKLFWMVFFEDLAHYFVTPEEKLLPLAKRLKMEYMKVLDAGIPSSS